MNVKHVQEMKYSFICILVNPFLCSLLFVLQLATPTLFDNDYCLIVPLYKQTNKQTLRFSEMFLFVLIWLFFLQTLSEKTGRRN